MVQKIFFADDVLLSGQYISLLDMEYLRFVNVSML